MTDHDKFVRRFKRIINDNYGGKIYQLAKELGYSDNTLYRYLNMEAFPSVVLLDRICDKFGVSMDYLTGRTDNER